MNRALALMMGLWSGTMGALAAPDAGAAKSPANEARPIAYRPLPALAPMQTVLLPIENSPIVDLRLVFRAGSVDDPPGKEGLTNLAASLLEQGGTKDLSSSALLEALFPMAAELSISTTKEFTVVSGRVHQDSFDGFLKIFTDVLVEPRFDPKEFARLKTDALNDIKNSLRSEDDELLGKVALEALIYRGHPYQHYIGGTVQGLSGITLEDVKAQVRAVFTQDRLVLGMAGAVTPALEQKVKERLSSLPATGVERKPLPPSPAVQGAAVLVEKDSISTAVSMGFAYPLRRGDADFYALALASSYLGEHRQFNGVLFNELREKRGLNYGDYAYAEHFSQQGGGTYARTNIARSQQDFSLWLRPVEPQNAMFATRGALYFLDKMIREGLSKESFELTRGFLMGYTRLWEQTAQRRLGYAIDDLIYGVRGYLDSYREALARMTVEQVNEAVKKHLSLSKLNYAFVVKDAAGLEKMLTEQKPSPIQYPSPKAAAVMEEDTRIEKQAVPLRPALIRRWKAASFMESTGTGE